MEKRHKNTRPGTLRWRAAWAKLTLIGTLFIPGVFALDHLPRQANTPAPEPIMDQTTKPRPKELVKIYSIVKSNRPDISDDEAWKVSDVILEESSKHGLDPLLVLAVIEVESGFRYTAVSPMGARGIMQIMPEVGKALVRQIGLEKISKSSGFRPEHLDDPILNIKLGVYYLYDLNRSFRNLNLALIAYNVGPTEIQNRLDNNIEFPDDFASLVLAAHQKHKKAKQPSF
jgi:soluble lytic murein transglycosylase-like protein